MKKTRKISMIPEFLRNRKTYMLTALVFTIIGVLSLSFAFFQFADDTDLTSSNTIMVETMNISDITKTFTVTYEGNNGLIKTGILNAGFTDIYKFKVTNNYDESYPIGINWDLVRSTVTQTNTSYTLYTCTQSNYTSATIDNVASLCTAISPNTDNYLPKTNEMHKLTSTNEITLGANETQYYIAKIVINNTESGKSFNGAIRVKHRETHTLTLNLDGGDITCDTVADMKTGDTVVLPIPTKTGYVFEGWSIGEVDSVINHYTFTMGSMDTTLTASWTANVQTFLYSGNVQIFTAPQTGTYKVEAWGARGGNGGEGAYTKGEIFLEKDQMLYVYVGGAGSSDRTPGWNGGGTGGYEASGAFGGGGGGSTDIRYFSNDITTADLTWNSTIGLNSRIMVAAGGGGTAYQNGNTWYGGGGGGLIGNNASRVTGGSQTAGYGFGVGGSCPSGSSCAGSGGGYYGGYYGADDSGGGGGSSYISGHNGCNSIYSVSNRQHVGNSLHFSNKYFIYTKMISGSGYSWSNAIDVLEQMPNPDGGFYAAGRGRVGHGYARITFNSYLEPSPSEILNNIQTILNNYYFTYSGNYQLFNAFISGIYQIEAWGASGGLYGGAGAYTKGEINLEKDEKLYIYVGSAGSIDRTPGWNGGGTGGYESVNGGYGGGGGGATDIRYFVSTPTADELVWNSETGLNSRIMVAGGGGGGAIQNGSIWYGGAAGGLTGNNGSRVISGNQTAGYGFGIGGSCPSGSSCAGSGGGYYGGYYGADDSGGGGGSSYISGHNGCNSILSISDRTSIGTSLHFSNKYFTNTKMISGAGYSWSSIRNSQELMNNPDGPAYSLGGGRVGNGYVIVKLLTTNVPNQETISDEKLEKTKNGYYPFKTTLQMFKASQSGTYKVEAWGAQGGAGGGGGGYTSGEIYLLANEVLYIFVGGVGGGAQQIGLNGGGQSGYESGNGGYGGGGGGSTDIRYFADDITLDELNWNSATGLNSRIMVAAGGGGTAYQNGTTWSGGAAGGLIGYSGSRASGGTQINGYSFGQGGACPSGASCAGSGGGYYGGYYGADDSGGGGGSSYISGHEGCLAINDLTQLTSPRDILTGCTSTSTNVECSYSKNLSSRIIQDHSKYFVNTIMIDGTGYGWSTVRNSSPSQMPIPEGGIYGVGAGRTGNGYARITLVED